MKAQYVTLNIRSSVSVLALTNQQLKESEL